MAWVRTVGGRLKSDYRYSASMVYNTFPWPEPDAKQRAAVEKAAQAVLDARKPHIDGGASLADLYDPLAMPAELRKLLGNYEGLRSADLLPGADATALQAGRNEIAGVAGFTRAATVFRWFQRPATSA